MPHTIRNLNALGLIAVTAVLSFAFYDQFFSGELPCPLCLLQRLGFAGVLVGLLLNVCLGCRPAHYSLATLAAVFGAAVALRQISLHVIPGTPAYGEAFFGYHFYTWAFITFSVIILGVAIISSFGQQYNTGKKYVPFQQHNLLCKIAIVLTLIIVLFNALVSFAQCGPYTCPDTPVQYWLFN